MRDPKEIRDLVDSLNMTRRELHKTLTVAMQLTDKITQIIVTLIRVYESRYK